jgi:hypothetical protein
VLSLSVDHKIQDLRFKYEAASSKQNENEVLFSTVYSTNHELTMAPNELSIALALAVSRRQLP